MEEKRLFYVALTRTKNKLYYISETSIKKKEDEHLLTCWYENLIKKSES